MKTKHIFPVIISWKKESWVAQTKFYAIGNYIVRVHTKRLGNTFIGIASIDTRHRDWYDKLSDRIVNKLQLPDVGDTLRWETIDRHKMSGIVVETDGNVVDVLCNDGRKCTLEL